MNFLTNLSPAAVGIIASDLFPNTINDFCITRGYTSGSGGYTYDPIIEWKDDFFIKDFRPIEAILKDISKEFVRGDRFPRINVTYNKKTFEYVIEASIAGINKDDITVIVDSGYIKFDYKHGDEKGSDEEYIEYLHKEISTSSFQKMVKIPDTADVENIKTSYADGVVKITIPKKESSRPKQLKF